MIPTSDSSAALNLLQYKPGMKLSELVDKTMPLGNMKCTDAMIHCMEAEGVEYIFGVPGEENLDLLESLRKSHVAGKIKLILTRHEQAAGFMAATVGRLTGHPGVCLSTLGPGATNFSTAAAYAQLGGMPMFIITGQKPIRHSKQGKFQIVDIVGHFRPLTKFTKQVPDANTIPSLVRESIRISRDEKPGPVHLELPEDIATHLLDEREHVFPIRQVRRPVADAKAIAQACALIHAAKRPLLCVGAGSNRKVTLKMLRKLMAETGLYAVSTQMGKGVVDETNEQYIGCTALSANDWVHAAVEQADLIINVGHDSVEKPPFFMSHNQTPVVIHVNFYQAVMDEVYFPQMEVVGDIGNAVWQICEKLAEMPKPDWDFRLFAKVREVGHAAMHLSPYTTSEDFPMNVQRVVKDVHKCMPDDGIVCLDNGMYKIWFARLYEARCPNTVLLDNALATMGAGLPSAIAAKLTLPDVKVVAISGDGGFMMNSQELETAVRLGIHVVQIVLNDNGYGMIKWKQHEAGFSNWGLEYLNPDFPKYAESYGAKGHLVTKPDELVTILKECLETPGVHLIEVPITYASSAKELDEELKPAVNDLRKILAEMTN